MTEETKHQYKPTLIEIVREMGREAVMNVNHAISEILDVSIRSSGFAVFFNIAPYAIPSVIRKIKRRNAVEIWGEDACYCGSIVTTAGLCGQLYAYVNHNPKYALIPLATNIASGLYEWQRHARKKISEKRFSERINGGERR